MPPESALQRKLLGPMAAWGVTEMLLRNIDHRLAGANWQRSGGKGKKPQPVELPQPARRQSAKVPDAVARLRAAGLIPAGDAKNPPVDGVLQVPGVVTVVE